MWKHHVELCITYFSYIVVIILAAYGMISYAWFHIMEGVGIQVDKITHHIGLLSEGIDDLYRGNCKDIMCHHNNPSLDMINQPQFINY